MYTIIETLTGEKLGQKLLQSAQEMQLGEIARSTKVDPIEAAKARMKTNKHEKVICR